MHIQKLTSNDFRHIEFRLQVQTAINLYDKHDKLVFIVFIAWIYFTGTVILLQRLQTL